MKFQKIVFIAPAILGLLISGCNSGGPDPKVEENRVENAKRMRAIFDKAGGDMARLSPDEKTEFVKFFNGSEQDAQQTWDLMKFKSQGETSAGSAAPGVPGGFAPGMPGGRVPSNSASPGN